MIVKTLLLVFYLREVLGSDCAENETRVVFEKFDERNLGITEFRWEDWSVKNVNYLTNRRTVACLFGIKPGWRVTKLKIENEILDVHSSDYNIRNRIKATLENPHTPFTICFDANEEKARFSKVPLVLNMKFREEYEILKESSGIEYDWSNWTVKSFDDSKREKLLQFGLFPRVKAGWKITKVHFWDDKEDPIENPMIHQNSNSIKNRLLDHKKNVPYTITFQKQHINDNANDVNPKEDTYRNWEGRDLYVTRRTMEGGTQVYEAKILKRSGNKYSVKYKGVDDKNFIAERDVHHSRIWEALPKCNKCERTGHTASFCPDTKCETCSRFGHKKTVCAVNSWCKCCKQLGHHGESCSNVLRCYNCWRTGHTQKYCFNEAFYLCCGKSGHKSCNCFSLTEKRTKEQENVLNNVINTPKEVADSNSGGSSSGNTKNNDETQLDFSHKTLPNESNWDSIKCYSEKVKQMFGIRKHKYLIVDRTTANTSPQTDKSASSDSDLNRRESNPDFVSSLKRKKSAKVCENIFDYMDQFVLSYFSTQSQMKYDDATSKCTSSQVKKEIIDNENSDEELVHVQEQTSHIAPLNSISNADDSIDEEEDIEVNAFYEELDPYDNTKHDEQRDQILAQKIQNKENSRRLKQDEKLAEKILFNQMTKKINRSPSDQSQTSSKTEENKK